MLNEFAHLVEWRPTEEEALEALVFVGRVTMKPDGKFVIQFRLEDGNWSPEVESPEWDDVPESEKMKSKEMPNPIYVGISKIHFTQVLH